MKSSPEHLPQWKQDELAHVVNVILSNSGGVAMVVLFGSYARGDYKEVGDLEPDRKSGHVSDYDILVITGTGEAAYDTVLWDDVEKECWRLGLSARTKLIAHDLEYVNSRLAEGQYFFRDIDRQGYLLYSSGEFTLAKEKCLTKAEKLKIARKHYEKWFESANDFYFLFEKSKEAKKYTKAAFNLNQAAESAYKTILLVLTNYCPHEHFLGVLGAMAEEHDARLCNIFPRGTKSDQNRFKLFDYAYIGARYDMEYKISEQDLELLSQGVQRLLDLTEVICQEAIHHLGSSNGSAQ